MTAPSLAEMADAVEFAMRLAVMNRGNSSRYASPLRAAAATLRSLAEPPSAEPPMTLYGKRQLGLAHEEHMPLAEPSDGLVAEIRALRFPYKDHAFGSIDNDEWIQQADKLLERASNRIAALEQQLAQMTSDRDAKSKRMWELGHENDRLEQQLAATQADARRDGLRAALLICEREARRWFKTSTRIEMHIRRLMLMIEAEASNASAVSTIAEHSASDGKVGEPAAQSPTIIDAAQSQEPSK